MSEIRGKVIAIIVDKLNVEESEVTDGASFTNDLGADSLDTVELIMEFEKQFGISIPDVEEYNNFNLKEFISNALKPINSYNMYFDDSDKINNENKLAFVEYSTDSEVKEIDNTITMFFNQLKKDSIYKDDESDDEYVNYLEGMD